VGKNLKGMLIKRNLVFFILVFSLLLGTSISPSYGEEEGRPKWGFSFLGGFNARIHPSLIQVSFLPRLDLPLHNKWDLEFEGNFSYYGISNDKNLYLLGANANILFKPIQWKGGSLFVIGGVGLGYNNSNGKVHDFGDSHLAGVLQAGTGIYIRIKKNLWLRGEYRYQHISDPLNQDAGLDTHSFITGLSF
jgi:hypothetical protein